MALVGLGLSSAAMLARSPAQPDGVSLVATALAPVDYDITRLNPEQMAEMASPALATAANHLAATTRSSYG